MRAVALAVLLLAAAAVPAAGQRSGFADLSPALQAMQQDDAQNPGMLWVLEGEAAFAAGCASCHTPESLRSAAARHPAFDETAGRPVSLAGRVNQCRQRRLGVPPLAPESQDMLALTAYLGYLSRGLPVDPPADPRLDGARARGAALFATRFGQLNLSCAQCHDQAAGQRLAGSLIPEGHPNGYPLYRLEWQTLGSLQRRLRNCMVGVRAEPFAPDSDEALALELHLTERARGLAIETPAIRP
ncbi:MAG: sulfur oxidation c-type cytochrome SoxA [Thalassobaculales bacterium]